ncbi:MAG: hypothetical protein ACRERV_04845 [Methylococcales bacterium]
MRDKGAFGGRRDALSKRIITEQVYDVSEYLFKQGIDFDEENARWMVVPRFNLPPNWHSIARSTAPMKELVGRGYVSGLEIKEPAVKTVNTIVGAMTVEVFLNQYSERQPHTPILVFENNNTMAIYADTLSLESRNTQCFACGIFS